MAEVADLARAPAALGVDATTDRIRVRFPGDAARRSAWTLSGAVVALLGGFVTSLSMVGGVWPALGVAVIAVLLGVILLLVAARLRWEIELNRHSLEVRDRRGEQVIPLASIRDVGVADGVVFVDWTEGRFEATRRLRPNQATWLEQLIEFHARNARRAEMEDGLDVDRPATTPEELRELMRREAARQTESG